ncbi:MAG: sigma-54-dependent Fis family transcriptional regulator [Bdellovibrionales bacterium]|nr:sigma-54-dependent Fis family transcriptional regulator [Bdellovibrionales bacterium]
MAERDFSIIQTADPRMKTVLNIAENVAASRAAVLILGESGTGKELLARYIHARSPRASQRFVAINCAAVPDNLLESELFGYEKGAFTGADVRRAGRFELANNSTFLLDEVSEMPILLQAKLLRVIQEGEVERLGGSGPVKVNVRIVATSNRDLRQLVDEGRFREDLYYRLNVIPLQVPPLRSRPLDIEMLAQMFMEISCHENGVSRRVLSLEAIEKLKSWKWPGNVRELQNVIERSVLLSADESIGKEGVLINGYDESVEENRLRPGMTVSEAEKLLILKTLEHTGQNRTHAAEMLGISIRTLRNKINEYKEVIIHEQSV